MTKTIEQRGDHVELVAIEGEQLSAVTFVQDYQQLCGLIAKNVARAYVRPGDRLQIDFKDFGSLIVSLKPDAYRAAEALIFSDGKTEQWAVW